MKKLDRCAKFSIEYLDIIQDILHIDSDYEFDIDKINNISIQRLNRELDDFFKSSHFENARIDMEEYTKGERVELKRGFENRYRIQTTAVGFATDFDTLIKLGLVVGDRVILWDTMFTNIRKQKVIRASQLFAAAIGLLKLRSLIEAGGACLLPPPIIWSDVARQNFSKFAPVFDTVEDGLTASRLQGFINARSLLEEDGIELHPYVFNSDVNENRRIHRLLIDSQFLRKGDQYRAGAFEQQASIQKILTDERLLMLKNASPLQLYRALHQSDSMREKAHRELVSHLALDDSLSEAQRKQRVERAVHSLSQLIPAHNASVRAQAMDLGSSGIAVIEAFLGILNHDVGMTLFGLFFAGITSAKAIYGFYKSMSKRNTQLPLIQVFSTLEEEADIRDS